MEFERGDPLLSSSRPDRDPVVTIRVRAARDPGLSVAAVGLLARMLARPGEPIRLGDLGTVDEQRMLTLALAQLLERGYVRVDAGGVHHLTDDPVEPGPVLVTSPVPATVGRPPALEVVPDLTDTAGSPRPEMGPPEPNALSPDEQAQVNEKGRARVKAMLRTSRTPVRDRQVRTLQDLLEVHDVDDSTTGTGGPGKADAPGATETQRIPRDARVRETPPEPTTP